MKKSEIEQLEKVTGQLEGLHQEITTLAKKSPNDALNAFKLNFVNSLLNTANTILGEKYKPFESFEQFDSDDVPSNSDVTLVVGQYLEELERKRADNLEQRFGAWYHHVEDSTEPLKAASPRKLQQRK